MAKDYKHRVRTNNSVTQDRRTERSSHLGLFRWMLFTALIISFVVFLVYLRSVGLKHTAPEPEPPAKSETEIKKTEANKPEEKAESGPVLPQFDFYTILPEKEVIVPDYEINTRAREERVGQAKSGNYILQAGSFRDFKDADSLRARLALMGIESKIEKAVVGNATWNRVKIGPYTQMASVSTIRSRLRENGIDVIVIEAGN